MQKIIKIKLGDLRIKNKLKNTKQKIYAFKMFFIYQF